MSLIALAIVMAAQASTPSQPDSLFAGLPCFDYQGAKHCVRSIAVSGKKKDMDAVRAKLTSEGWPSSYRTDRSGRTVLELDPRNRTLDDAWALTNRFASREFGPLQADFVTLPPSGAK